MRIGVASKMYSASLTTPDDKRHCCLYDRDLVFYSRRTMRNRVEIAVVNIKVKLEWLTRSTEHAPYR